jgi:hypothetical protein
MATSAVPATEKALIQAMRSHQALSGVLVSPAWPGADSDREMVFLGYELLDWNLEVPTMKSGRKHRDETFTLQVIAWVFMESLHPSEVQKATDRAHELIDVVDDILADDPTLGGVECLSWALPADGSRNVGPVDKGYAVEATRNVSAKARLL